MFDVAADDYDRFMGRFSAPLAHEFARFAGVRPVMSVLDVGCGTGMLSTVLAGIVGAADVAAIDPQELFVTATRSRVPGADVRRGVAEDLPWPDGSFDAALSQLVVAFMADAPTGIREMSRVVRDGGLVAYAMWDRDELAVGALFEAAANAVGLATPRETIELLTVAGVRKLADTAGLTEVDMDTITVSSAYDDFEDLWATYALQVGPLGSHYRALEEAQRQAIRTELRHLLGDPAGQVELTAKAVVVAGRPARVE